MQGKLQVLKSLNKYHLATFITLLFHIFGCIGMFTSYQHWFISYTPLNLLIVFVLVLLTQVKNTAFFGFMALCFVTGMLVEMIGVKTGYLFGDYQYGSVLGPKLFEVPLLIGINWFIVVYCSGVVVTFFHNWLAAKYQAEGRILSPAIMNFSFVMDAALLTTFFDWLMEPVAVKLGFWHWNGTGEIPLLNYACWFVISSLLLAVFRRLRFDKENLFAVHLFIIQLLFFGALRTFLQ